MRRNLILKNNIKILCPEHVSVLYLQWSYFILYFLLNLVRKFGLIGSSCLRNQLLHIFSAFFSPTLFTYSVWLIAFKSTLSFFNVNHTAILQERSGISHKDNCVIKQRRLCRAGWQGAGDKRKTQSYCRYFNQPKYYHSESLPSRLHSQQREPGKVLSIQS